MRVLVAGAGIAGSCAARLLRADGHDVIVADPAPHTAASRCALAYLRPSWFKGEERIRLRGTLDWYGALGCTTTADGYVYDLRRGRRFMQSGHVLIDPVAPLVKPDTPAALKQWASHGSAVRVVLGDGLAYNVDRLVIATGGRYGLQGARTHGGMFVAPGNLIASGKALAVLRITDRLAFKAAYAGGTTRVGASLAAGPEAARERADRMLSRMIDEGVVNEGEWAYRSGVRFTYAGHNGIPAPVQLDQNVWALEGFARSGYATAPAAARDLVWRLR